MVNQSRPPSSAKGPPGFLPFGGAASSSTLPLSALPLRQTRTSTHVYIVARSKKRARMHSQPYSNSKSVQVHYTPNQIGAGTACRGGDSRQRRRPWAELQRAKRLGWNQLGFTICTNRFMLLAAPLSWKANRNLFFLNFTLCVFLLVLANTLVSDSLTTRHSLSLD